MPQRFARSGHPHRQRQQRQHHAAGRVVPRSTRLVAADARVVIDVARLGHADHRMNQQPCVADFRGARKRQLFVRAVHRVARLERDDVLQLSAAKSARSCAGVRRRAGKS